MIRHRKNILALLFTIAGVLFPLGMGMAISVEHGQWKLWSALTASLQKRDRLVPNLIYLIKSNPNYPDLEGAATLFRMHKTCEAFDPTNTLNGLSLCVVELGRRIQEQQSTLAPRLAKSPQLAHWKQLAFELDRASSAVQTDCAKISTRWRTRPTLSRPFLWPLAQQDWAAARVCE